MNGITSFRYLLFLMAWVMFWLFAPLFIVRLFAEGPLNELWILVSLAFAYFALPKINRWLVFNTPFGHVWTWARANEETP